MHHRPASALIPLLCGLATGTVWADPDHTYLEEDGIILFEVEDALPPEGWALKTDEPDYRGSGYFEWTGPDSFPLSSAGKGTITYHFRIQTPGNYQVRWRSRIVIGESNTEANDSWIRLATGVDVPEEQPLDGWTKVYMNTLGSWTWTSKTVDHVGDPIRQYFSQGDHTLEISGRSIGHAIDTIALYRYEDVNYNANRIENWELSSVVTGDGTVVDPNHSTDPEGETGEETGEETEQETEEGTGEEETEETTPPVSVDRENLYIADDSWEQIINNECIDNTLALPASAIMAFDPSDSASAYRQGEYLTVSSETSTLLARFDLSLVPQASSAVIEYSTGALPADGSLRYALASHSDWPGEDGTAAKPEMMLSLSQSSGGWNADARMQSTLPAELLGNAVHTIMISSDTGSDPLEIYSQHSSELLPRLLLSGDSDFCVDWQANVDAQNAPVEPPPEVNEVVPPETDETDNEPEVTTPSEPDETETAESRKSSSGGSLSWLSLLALLLPGLYRTQSGRHSRKGRGQV